MTTPFCAVMTTVASALSMITKDLTTYTVLFLRQEKTLRDHGERQGPVGTWGWVVLLG
jgi:hypothetical protein